MARCSLSGEEIMSADSCIPHPERDRRACPSAHVMRAMHRTMLLCPVIGIPPAMEAMVDRVTANVEGRECRRELPLTAPSPLQAAEGADGKGSSVYTWKVQGSRLVIIFKSGPTTTIMWDHKTRTAFKASPCASLGPGCPTGSAFLAQVVMDRIEVPIPQKDEGETQGEKEDAEENEEADKGFGWKLNILVFDILSIADTVYFESESLALLGFQCVKRSAQERYMLLRAVHDGISYPRTITSDCIHVQWAGDIEGLVQFEAMQGESISHIIQLYLRLGDTDPCAFSLFYPSAVNK